LNYGKIIYEVLSNDSDVGGVAGNKIYPGRATQGAKLPYIVYTNVTNPPLNSKEFPAKVDQPTFQLDCFSNTKKEVDDLTEKVRAALEGNTGNIAGFEVDGAMIEDVSDNFDEDRQLQRTSMDVKLFINR